MIRALPCCLLTLSLAPGVAAQETVQLVHPRRTIRIPGTVIPEERLELKARVTGYISEIPVDYGTEVKKGDLLVRLEVPELEAELKRGSAAIRQAEAGVGDAEAAIEVAVANVERAKAQVEICAAEVTLAEIVARRKRRLFERKSATQEEVDEADGQLAMARARGEAAGAGIRMAEAKVQAAKKARDSAKALADLEKAEVDRLIAQLRFATMRCPFKRAVVTGRFLDRGALVRAGETAIVTLARRDRVRVDVRVPERDAIHVRRGTKVELALDARPKEAIRTIVSRTAKSLSSSSVMKVQIDLDNEKGRFMPGMFLYVWIFLDRGDATLTLPPTAVRTDVDGDQFVFVAERGENKELRARKVDVVTVAEGATRIAILKGLKGDEDVIVSEADLKDGAAVKVQPGGGKR